MKWYVTFFPRDGVGPEDGKEIEADSWASGSDGFIYFRRNSEGEDALPKVVAAVAQNAVKAIELVEAGSKEA